MTAPGADQGDFENAMRTGPKTQSRVREVWRALSGKRSNRTGSDELIADQGTINPDATNSFVGILFAVVLTSAALYFGRVLLEPIAYALFAMALVRPVQEALEARMSKSLALLSTILLTLVLIVGVAAAIIWSVSDIVHWVLANLPRFQELYDKVANWAEGHGVYVGEAAGLYDSRTFVRFLQQIVVQLNSFAGFSLVVFLLVTFGLTELSFFAKRFDELEPRIGWKISSTAGDIAKKIRTYMVIKTLASVVTGLAVFAYTYYFGLELAIAWGVISFVLNYIPYLGTLIAVALPVLFSGVQFQSWEAPLILFVGLYVIQLFIGNYLEPIVASKAFAVSPFIMLIAFFYWGFLWGLPGAFIGLPMTIAFLTICQKDPSRRWIVRLLSDSE